MEERVSLLRAYDSGAFTIVDLCARYGVSRETFYYWRRRRDSGDSGWFQDRSHAVQSCPHSTAPLIVSRVIALRRRFVHFGPKKIKAWLELHEPQTAWPAASTIGDILARAGLIEPHKRASRAKPQGDLPPLPDQPNAEWVWDFKGWFRTGDGIRCDPLTITDSASRYLIAARITPMTTRGVYAVLERVFRDNGLPDAMRSDNGAPFGSRGPGGLSSLSVRLLKLGIAPRFIPPASPQDNGAHERMHRTLKAQTSAPPAANVRTQQARFDVFRRHYNTERPHEALDQKPPAHLWNPSRRTMPGTLAEPWYDADCQTRRVRTDGTIKWRGELVFIGEALAGESIGLRERDGGAWLATFFDHELGLINHDARFLRFAPPRARRRPQQTSVTPE